MEPVLRHIRSNLIAYLALFVALSGGSFAVAALNRPEKRVVKRIVNKQITRRAPRLSVKYANGANEARHAGTAESAGSIGGVSIEPVRITLPDGGPPAPVVLVDGSFLRVSACSGGQVGLQFGRTPTSPPLLYELVDPGGTVMNLLVPGSSVTSSNSKFGLRASIREGSGRVTRIFIDGFYEQNSSGGADDCFVQGTIERFG